VEAILKPKLHRITEERAGRLLERFLASKPSAADVVDGYGTTALMIASQDGWTAGVRLLLEAGANTNARNLTGYTPLHSAVDRDSNADVICILVKAGANINARGHEGRTALIEATCHHSGSNIRELIRLKADVNMTDEGRDTALMYAASGGDLFAINKLLVAGAKVNLIGRGGQTALMWAVCAARVNPQASLKAVHRLLDAGADPKIKSTKGYDALTLAESIPAPRISALIRQQRKK